MRQIGHSDGGGHYQTGGSKTASPHEVRHGETRGAASASRAAGLEVRNRTDSDSSGSTLDQSTYDRQQNTEKKAKASKKGSSR